MRSAKGWSLVLVSVAATACANPLWRFDRYHVQGQLHGPSCLAKMDGTDLTGPTGWPVRVHHRALANPGMRSVDSAVAIVCGTSLIILVVPESTQVVGSQFRVMNAADYHVPRGSARILLDVVAVRDMPWDSRKFAGTELRGASGTLAIERIANDSVFGSFDFIARRAIRTP